MVSDDKKKDYISDKENTHAVISLLHSRQLKWDSYNDNRLQRCKFYNKIMR